MRSFFVTLIVIYSQVKNMYYYYYKYLLNENTVLQQNK